MAEVMQEPADLPNPALDEALAALSFLVEVVETQRYYNRVEYVQHSSAMVRANAVLAKYGVKAEVGSDG